MKTFKYFLVLFLFITNCGSTGKHRNNKNCGSVVKNQHKGKFAMRSESCTGISHLKLSNLPPKKQIVFRSSIHNFHHKVAKSKQTMTAYVWRNPKAIYSDLFSQKFRNYSSNISSTQSFLDFEPNRSSMSFFVDFAARKLGGGWRTSGWVQEEIMFSEIPQLGNYELGGLFTRTRLGSSRPQKGYPQPIVFKNAKRMINFNSKCHGVYGGRNLVKATHQEIKNSIETLNSPQNVNILAISAPRLTDHNPKSLGVLKDLFQTSYSGFQLVKKLSKNQSAFIGTGKFGAGAFKNDPIVSNVIQQLSAFHANINDIKFYGYSSKEQIKANQIVAHIKKTINKTTTIHELLTMTHLSI
jgi:hypothetical protein